MSKCGEAWQEMQDALEDDGGILAMEEQAYYNAVNNVADFIESGSVSMAQFEKNLRETLNGQ